MYVYMGLFVYVRAMCVQVHTEASRSFRGPEIVAADSRNQPDWVPGIKPRSSASTASVQPWTLSPVH